MIDKTAKDEYKIGYQGLTDLFKIKIDSIYNKKWKNFFSRFTISIILW
ncbi:MAG: hypothetical protein MSA72_07385 [Lachnospiraceae bacterium]|nr:hypothetical protein [Lachnospiraceae bacterium]